MVAAGASFILLCMASVRPSERAPSLMSFHPRAGNLPQASATKLGHGSFSLCRGRGGGQHAKGSSASGLFLGGKVLVLFPFVVDQF